VCPNVGILRLTISTHVTQLRGGGLGLPTFWSRTSLDDTKSIELTAFACALSTSMSRISAAAISLLTDDHNIAWNYVYLINQQHLSIAFY